MHGLKLEGSLDDCREGGRIWWGLAWFEPLAMIGLDHRLSEITGGVIHTTFQYDRSDQFDISTCIFVNNGTHFYSSPVGGLTSQIPYYINIKHSKRVISLVKKLFQPDMK